MNKTVLVTGGAGFIGSHLCERLLETGFDVYSLDNYFSGSEDNHIPGVNYIVGHTREIESKISIKPSTIYHLGEYARVERSFMDVSDVLHLNITGTQAVIEYCRRHNVKLVYAGSSTKFGDGGMGRDQSPYAWTKASNTELVINYGNWFGLDYAVTYFYNVYGGREIQSGHYATLIGLFKSKYLKGQPLPIVSPGIQRRNFTHVNDIVSGLLLVGEKGYGDGYGLGHSKSYSVVEVAGIFGSETEILPERKGNRMDATLDTSRSKNELKWQALIDLEDHITDFKHN